MDVCASLVSPELLTGLDASTGDARSDTAHSACADTAAARFEVDLGATTGTATRASSVIHGTLPGWA